jgi:hypothetical protein
MRCTCIATGGDHRIDGRVEIGMFLFQACKLETNLGLFLFRHIHRSAGSGAHARLMGGVRQPSPAARTHYHISRRGGMLPHAIRQGEAMVAHCHLAVTRASAVDVVRRSLAGI